MSMKKATWRNDNETEESSYHMGRFAFFPKEKMLFVGYSGYSIGYVLIRLVLLLLFILAVYLLFK